MPTTLRWLMGPAELRTANRATAQRVLDWTPQRVIFAHDAWFERDAAAQLERTFA
jgi:hypothetical protein